MSSFTYTTYEDYNSADALPAGYYILGVGPQSDPYQANQSVTLSIEPTYKYYELTVANTTVMIFTSDDSGYYTAPSLAINVDYSDNTASVNLTGAGYSDILRGGSGADGLNGGVAFNGGGGPDSLYGGAGNDRLAISSTPTMVDGGADTDTLSIQNAASVTLTDTNFTAIERVVVQNGGSVDMSGVTTAPSAIISTSTVGDTATIIGTEGADRIHAGQGTDSITGGLGADKIFAGLGNDTFHHASSGFGRDTIYWADLTKDTFDVAGLAGSMADLRFYSAGGSADTIVKGVHDHLGDAIVLKGITVAAIQAGGQFTF